MWHDNDQPRLRGRMTKDITIWCGLCDYWEYIDTLNDTFKSAAKEARTKGWQKTRKHGWICPYCAGTRDPADKPAP